MMPIKRRTGKSRQFDEAKACQLLAGMDVRLPGGGYLALPRAAALEEMRADWAIHGGALLAWWNGDDEAFRFRPWNFIVRDPDRLPWAAEQFGEPPTQPKN